MQKNTFFTNFQQYFFEKTNFSNKNFRKKVNKNYIFRRITNFQKLIKFFFPKNYVFKNQKSFFRLNFRNIEIYKKHFNQIKNFRKIFFEIYIKKFQI